MMKRSTLRYAVNAASQQRLFVISGVASYKDTMIVRLDNDGHMAERVTWGWYDVNSPVPGQGAAVFETFPGTVVEADDFRFQPIRIVHAEISKQRACSRKGGICLRFAQKDFAVRKLTDPAGMVAVHMGHDHPTHIERIEA